MEISGPSEWHALLEVLKEEKGISILLGATYRKSTLTVISNLC
jgi:hypothetical protein